MLDRLLSFLVALSLALLAWLYMRSRDQEMLDNITIPVDISLAPGQADHYDLETTGPSQVPVSFAGPPSRIRELRSLLQRGELRVNFVLAVPGDRLEESRFSDTVRIDADDVHPPPGITTVVQEGRNRIPITLRHLIERRLPVRFDSPVGQHIVQADLEPASVLVRGPQEVLDRVRAISTQPCPVPARTDPLSREVVTVNTVPLVEELEGRRVRTTPATVSAHLVFQPQQKLYELADLPVQFLCPANFGLRPLFNDERAGKMSLRLIGPTGEEQPACVAYIDLGGRKWEPGLYEEPVHVHLPKNFQLAQTPPRPLAFQLVPIEQGIKAPGASNGQ
jgi:hypothetical protein